MIKRRLLVGEEQRAAKHLFKLRQNWSPVGFCPLCGKCSVDKNAVPGLPPFVGRVILEHCRDCDKFFKRTDRILTMDGWGRPDAMFKKFKAIQPGEDEMRLP